MISVKLLIAGFVFYVGVFWAAPALNREWHPYDYIHWGPR